jgi:hypothetical protein
MANLFALLLHEPALTFTALSLSLVKGIYILITERNSAQSTETYESPL